MQVGEDVVASDDALRKGMSRSQSTAKAMIKIASGKNPIAKGTYTLTFAGTFSTLQYSATATLIVQ